jgi:hypothetical protein
MFEPDSTWKLIAAPMCRHVDGSRQNSFPLYQGCPGRREVGPFMIAPIVRYMLLCDEVLQTPSSGKLTIVGLTSSVRWPSGLSIPLRLDRLVVMLILTDGRGKGSAQVICYNEQSGVDIFGSAEIEVSFEGRDPTRYYGVQFKLLNCKFPAPGVYIVRFLFGGTKIHEVPVTVR